MSDAPTKGEHRTRCPICDGHGYLDTKALLEQLTAPGLAERAAAIAAKIREEAAGDPAMQSAGSFEKRVHSWNPENPLWRRSNKE